MSDWRSEPRNADRWRNDERRDNRSAHDGEGRSFARGDRQERLEGDDYGGMGVRSAEWRRTDSGGGDQGEQRFGHSGGVDSGYGGQSGKAGFGPLSQGSAYGQGGSDWGHSGWEGGRPRSRPGERGTYGDAESGYAAERSRGRTPQYEPHDREGFVAYGRAYGDARPDDHDHEPGYRDWRDRQLAGHDADYRRWRDEQTRRYDDEYKAYRTRATRPSARASRTGGIGARPAPSRPRSSRPAMLGRPPLPRAHSLRARPSAT